MADATPDPRDLPPDPRRRLVFTPPFFYDPANVHRATEPEITSQSVAARGLRKTAVVVDLHVLRYLPYVAGPRNCWVTPEAYAVYYLAVVGASAAGPNRLWAWDLCEPGSSNARFPP
ncbi:hypothetical protein F5Y12DRAFT_712802 [Xylaria sp. FL1777]|nr:hypothetical protein F5Y12DRAFT_712802 [Xylaria sp. FL1777]